MTLVGMDANDDPRPIPRIDQLGQTVHHCPNACRGRRAHRRSSGYQPDHLADIILREDRLARGLFSLDQHFDTQAIEGNTPNQTYDRFAYVLLLKAVHIGGAKRYQRHYSIAP